MLSLIVLIDYLLALYFWIVFAYAAFGMLMSFGVVNAYNRAVSMIYEFLTRATEPVLRPIRKRMPNVGMLDLSTLVLLLAIWFLRMLLVEYGGRLVAMTAQ